MDTYNTIEEKYLKAVEEMNYGEAPRSLQLLNEILLDEPLYTRAHFQIAKLYYYDLNDYNAAGYHFKLCTDLDADFPDVYYHYIKLLVFLNRESLVGKVAAKALLVPGVDATDIYEQIALCYENNRKWNQAIVYYTEALMQVTDKQQKIAIEESLERVKFKIDKTKAYIYQLSE